MEESSINQGVKLRKRTEPGLGLLSGTLVSIASIFDQLQDEYLTFDQKAKFGLVLRRKYRELLALTARFHDEEMRRHLRNFLTMLGGISVRLVGYGPNEGHTFTQSLRWAIRTGRVAEWVNHFYCAIHQLEELRDSNRRERVELEEESYRGFKSEMASLWNWLEDRAER